MARPLCELPNELLMSIIDHVNDDKTLCALARVSKRYLPFAEANIYKGILLRSSPEAEKLLKALERRPERAELVQTINLRPAWHLIWHTIGVCFMRTVFRECRNLKDFTLESPTCNYGRWNGGSTTWREDEHAILNGLRDLNPQRLTKLTLHLDGIKQRYWDPAHLTAAEHSWSKVMALPSLTELMVSCAIIHEDIDFGPPQSTSLRELNLVECNITLKGLKKMLAAPKALERLHLGENAYHAGQGYSILPGRNYNNLFGFDPSAFINALAQQSHSLEKLEYVAGDPKFPSQSVKETFEDFVRLKEVRLSEYVRDSCRELILTGAPALERMITEITALHVFGPIMRLEEELGVGAGKLDDDTVRKRLMEKVASALFTEPPKASLASLKTLHVIMPHGPVPVTESRRTWVRMLSDYWTKHGVQFFLYYSRRSSIFPPILFNEDKKAPRDELLFGSAIGFTEAANAPDPFGFNDPFQMDFMTDHDHDLLAEFDFDSFLHHTDDDWNVFGDYDLTDFQATFGYV